MALDWRPRSPRPRCRAARRPRRGRRACRALHARSAVGGRRRRRGGARGAGVLGECWGSFHQRAERRRAGGVHAGGCSRRAGRLGPGHRGRPRRSRRAPPPRTLAAPGAAPAAAATPRRSRRVGHCWPARGVAGAPAAPDEGQALQLVLRGGARCGAASALVRAPALAGCRAPGLSPRPAAVPAPPPRGGRASNLSGGGARARRGWARRPARPGGVRPLGHLSLYLSLPPLARARRARRPAAPRREGARRGGRRPSVGRRAVRVGGGRPAPSVRFSNECAESAARRLGLFVPVDRSLNPNHSRRLCGAPWLARAVPNLKRMVGWMSAGWRLGRAGWGARCLCLSSWLAVRLLRSVGGWVALAGRRTRFFFFFARDFSRRGPAGDFDFGFAGWVADLPAGAPRVFFAGWARHRCGGAAGRDGGCCATRADASVGRRPFFSFSGAFPFRRGLPSFRLRFACFVIYLLPAGASMGGGASRGGGRRGAPAKAQRGAGRQWRQSARAPHSAPPPGLACLPAGPAGGAAGSASARWRGRARAAMWSSSAPTS